MRAWLPVLACVLLAGCPGRYDIDPIDSGASDAPRPPDSGPADTGTLDAGSADAGRSDAGPDDAGPTDGGADASRPDTGSHDAGRDAGVDGGIDSGPPEPRDAGIDARIDAPTTTGDCLGTCSGPSMPRDPRECFSEAEAASLDLVRTTAEMNGTMCPDGRSIIGFTLTRAGGCVRAPAFFCGA